MRQNTTKNRSVISEPVFSFRIYHIGLMVGAWVLGSLGCWVVGVAGVVGAVGVVDPAVLKSRAMAKDTYQQAKRDPNPQQMWSSGSAGSMGPFLDEDHTQKQVLHW